MNLNDLLQRIHEVDPQALQGGPAGATPDQRRLLLAAFNAVRQALNTTRVDERVSIPRLGQFRLRNDHAATGPGAVRRMVFSPEASANTASVDSACWQRALLAPMPPLIHPQHRFVVVFSAKAACSTVVIWYLHTMGLLDDARRVSEWPHDYRVRELHQRSEDRDARQKLAASDVTLLRVVRDPVERAASSFRHALGTGYAREAIQRALGVDTATDGLSFERFIDFLETENLATCDPHHALQVHPVERLKRPDMVVNISTHDLFEGLNAFERSVGMPPTDFAALPWVHALQASRALKPSRRKPPADPYRAVLTAADAQKGPWPKGLVTAQARARLMRLYAEDVAQYGTAA